MAFLPAWVPVVTGILGLGATAYGLSYQASAASNAADYQAQVARNNAKAARQKEQYAAESAEQRGATASRRSASRVASVKAAQAAGGVNVNVGSPVDVRAGTAQVGRLDTETERHNALLAAYGYRAEATSDETQAGLLESQADTLGTAGAISTASTLLGGASSLGYKWQGLQRDGGALSKFDIDFSNTFDLPATT